MSMDCAYRLSGINYIDQATLRTGTTTTVFCECDVIGVTDAGHFGTFDPTPRGMCVLTVTRCPTSSNILSRRLSG